MAINGLNEAYASISLARKMFCLMKIFGVSEKHSPRGLPIANNDSTYRDIFRITQIYYYFYYFIYLNLFIYLLLYIYIYFLYTIIFWNNPKL